MYKIYIVRSKPEVRQNLENVFFFQKCKELEKKPENGGKFREYDISKRETDQSAKFDLLS